MDTGSLKVTILVQYYRKHVPTITVSLKKIRMISTVTDGTRHVPPGFLVWQRAEIQILQC